MKRREFITLLGGAATAWPVVARAQQARRRRIAILMGVADDSEGQARIAAFRQTLQGLGWTESHNVQFDYRWGPKDATQARAFAKQLVDLQPDFIFTQSTPATVAGDGAWVNVGDNILQRYRGYPVG